MESEEGKRIVIEGGDGVGKSTQIFLLQERLLKEYNVDSVVIEEPAGSNMGAKIRGILLDAEIDRDAQTDMFLFSAARCDTWNMVSLPALKMGKWVLSSRNWYSTLAYQGYASGVDLEVIRQLTEIATDSRYMNPDIETILSINGIREARKRIAARGKLERPDNFESKPNEFQQRVHEGYLKIAHERKIPIISANQPIEVIHGEIWQLVEASKNE